MNGFWNGALVALVTLAGSAVVDDKHPEASREIRAGVVVVQVQAAGDITLNVDGGEVTLATPEGHATWNAINHDARSHVFTTSHIGQ